MSGNSFGRVFQLTTFGESHGPAIGGIVDGCPAGLKLDLARVQNEVNRRRPGQSALTTQRDESDQVEWLSGLYNGQTTGAPLGFLIRNKDQNPDDYDHLARAFRPSHADYTYQKKYGIRDHRGGGRSSARETACRVVAGAVARQILEHNGIRLSAYVERVQDIAVPYGPKYVDPEIIDGHPTRCPDHATAAAMQERIEHARTEGDTVGGAIVLVGQGIPVGLGEPVFEKFQANLAKAMWSLPAVKSMEIGSGIAGTYMNGSKHNDRWTVDKNGLPRTETNHSGGIQGGITSGEELVLRIGFKPVSTLMKPQESIDAAGNLVVIEGKGRHDPCVLPRAVPLVEAMALLVLVDHWLINRASSPLV
ncbi:MAG: chorismate synthase [Bacteroidetes bacterium]|nr:chorismate synthase [Bacteroidota bacterium]MDA1336611.1 chorismate synthase [Bacteroidota bacterium]